MSDHSADVPKRVSYDLSDAVMRVQQEDGAFRHLAFASRRSWTRLTVITWPHNLLVAGSHGSFHFERLGDDTIDMLDWIRGMRIEPSHWAGKLANGRDSVEEYDRARLEALIAGRIAEAVTDGWASADGLEDAVREEVLDDEWMDSEQTAMRLVSEFEHGMTYSSDCSCGASEDHESYSCATLWQFYSHKQSGDDHKVSIRQTGGFTFGDIFDWQIHKLDYHFVYQCHALAWAVRRYDRVRRYGLQNLAAPKAVAS